MTDHDEGDEMYQSIGKIVVDGEHLCDAMLVGCETLLKLHLVPEEIIHTILAGHNLESMRRLWVSLMKLQCRDRPEVSALVDKIAMRLDNVIQRRNNTVHSRWSLAMSVKTRKAGLRGTKVLRDISAKGKGGVYVASRKVEELRKIVEEISIVQQLVYSISGTAWPASGLDDTRLS
jgi:hypothetical protein